MSLVLWHHKQLCFSFPWQVSLRILGNFSASFWWQMEMHTLFGCCFLNLLSPIPSQIDWSSKTSLNTIWKSGDGIMVKFCLHSEVFILFVILLIYTLARGKKLSCLWVAPWGAIQGHHSDSEAVDSLFSSTTGRIKGTFSPIFPCVCFTRTCCVYADISTSFDRALCYLSPLWEASGEMVYN